MRGSGDHRAWSILDVVGSCVLGHGQQSKEIGQNTKAGHATIVHGLDEL